MAQSDIPMWTFVGGFIGLITSYNVSPKFSLIGGAIGAIIGYIYAKTVQ